MRAQIELGNCKEANQQLTASNQQLEVGRLLQRSWVPARPCSRAQLHYCRVLLPTGKCLFKVCLRDSCLCSVLLHRASCLPRSFPASLFSPTGSVRGAGAGRAERPRAARQGVGLMGSTLPGAPGPASTDMRPRLAALGSGANCSPCVSALMPKL